ncbi:CocE/NonD family hydrolase [Oceanicoccus sp. KOV_DT_Chl]|uniref:alpha/beta hydrolase family protein n=1 Tax=Oceanicoccus sp. KOV_DT_Chl TaxID=1904639 RepID=UPI0013589B16|nr:CocE/NonD family hydrolase [Oceanicoccus sp. KOV_DT_Chl]
MIKKVLFSLSALLIIGAIIFITGKQPEPFVADSKSAEILKSGPYAVGSYTENLADNYRGTQANGDVMGMDIRNLDTVIWYPEQQGKIAPGQHPLIIYSHGFMSMKEGGAHIGQHLASHGYIVASANFPLTNYYTSGGAMVQDVVNQPADVSFIIDSLLQWSHSPDHLFSNSIDEQRIGATGISLGGMTTTMAAYHPEKRDPRIKVAASIAGPLSMFGRDFFAHHTIPFMMLAADIDALVEYQDNALPVLDRVKAAHLVTVTNASHTGFAAPAKYLRWLDNPDSVGCKQVLSQIDLTADDDSWHHLIGTEQQGIIYEPMKPLCSKMPLPSAMNVLRQHMITKVAILSFFQSQFADTEAERNRYQHYLTQEMAAELAEVSYQQAQI